MPDHRLRDTARRLRESDHLAPEQRQALAAAADRLADALASKDTPPEEAAQLGAAACDLLEAVNERHRPGLLAKARERLERAIVAAEARAPLATAMALQLIDALASIGI